MNEEKASTGPIVPPARVVGVRSVGDARPGPAPVVVVQAEQPSEGPLWFLVAVVALLVVLAGVLTLVAVLT